MTTDDYVRVLVSMGSGLLGGLVVAIVNHLFMFTWRKTGAETKKLDGEADKIRVETQKLLTEVQKAASTVQEDDQNVSQANSSLQLRHLVLAEKVS